MLEYPSHEEALAALSAMNGKQLRLGMQWVQGVGQGTCLFFFLESVKQGRLIRSRAR